MRTVGQLAIRDTLEELADASAAAVVVVDLQNDFCHAGGLYARHGKDIRRIERMLPTALAFISEAQDLGIRCVFVRQVTLPEGLSDSAAWMRFKTRDGKPPGYALSGTWGAELVEGLVPQAGDIAVEKFRPDAFHRTPLDLLLRANRLESLLILGVLTEGCVESTVRSASYHDYYTVVVEDCVASTHAVNHAGSMNLFRARYPMASSDSLLAIWRDAAGSGR